MSGTLKNLFVAANTAAGAGQSFIVTVFTSGSTTALTCTATGTTVVNFSDQIHTVAIFGGAVFFFQTQLSTTANTASFAFGIELSVPN
jgi:hypothetical protein